MGQATTQVIISGKDNLSSVVADAGRRMGTELQAMQRNVLSLQNAFIGLAGAAAIGQIKQSYTEYDTALRDMGKVTDESMDSIAAKIREVPAELGTSAELIRGYYQVISAGVTDPVKAMDALIGSTEAAKAAHVEQAEVIKGITKVMAGYAGDVKSASEAADLLFTIEKQGQTSFAELIPVIGDVAAVSKELGVEQKEMGAALAAVTLTAGSTSQAATQYRMMLVNLMKPTQTMQEALDAMGVSSGKAAIEQLGLAGTLERLQEYANGAGIQVGKLFESSESLLAVAALSRGEFAQYNTNLQAMEQRAGAADKAFRDWKNSTQAVDDLMRNTLTNTMVEIGGEVMPMLEAGAHTTASAIKFVGDNAHDAIGVTAVAAMGLLTVSLTKTGTSVAAWAAQTIAEQNRAVASTIRLHQAVVAGAQAEVIATERRLAAIPIMFRSVAAEQAAATAKHRLAMAETVLGTAQQKSTVVARGLSAVVGAMGGPIGIITTLLTAGATAWLIWGNKAEHAVDKAKNAAESAADSIRRMRDSQAFGEDALAPFREDIALAEAMLAEARKLKVGRMSSAMGEEEYTYIDEDAIRSAEAKVSQAYSRLQEAARINRKKLEASGAGVAAVVAPVTAMITTTSKEAVTALAKVNEEIAKMTLGDTAFAQYQLSDQYAQYAKDLGAANPELQKWLTLKEREIRLNELAALKSYQVTELESMNKGDMFYGKADADKRGQAMLDDLYQRNDELLVEFTERHREIVLGETSFKIEQLEVQAEAYRRAGVDEIALAQWVKQQKLDLSENWKDGAIRGWQSYAEEAGNAAKGVESVVGTTMHGLEDMTAEFFETGKIGWRDFVNTVNAEIGRLAFKQLSGQAFDWLGSALNLGMSAAGSYFGSTAVSSAAGSSGMAGTLSSFMSRSAHGNVFSGPGISEFSNTIVTQPTTFWAHGGNLMGEEGPEAIMPLRRMSNNDLGVKVLGGSDSEMKDLLRELIALNKAQKPQKNVFAFDKRTVANEMSGSEGRQVTLTHIRSERNAIRSILGI